MTKYATTVRLTDEDQAIIARLKERFGFTSLTQVIRFAIRSIDETTPETTPSEKEKRGVISDDRAPIG